MDSIINDIVQSRQLIMTSGLKDERHFPLSRINKIEKNVGNNKNFKSIKFNDAEEKEVVYEFMKKGLFIS